MKRRSKIAIAVGGLLGIVILWTVLAADREIGIILEIMTIDRAETQEELDRARERVFWMGELHRSERDSLMDRIDKRSAELSAQHVQP